MSRIFLPLLVAAACVGCGNPTAVDPRSAGAPGDAPATAMPTPQSVTPSFAVAGDCTGLLLSWFDGDGVHTAQSRLDIPVANRRQVRVASLTVDPAHRPDPDFVLVADLSNESDGDYPVLRMARAQFDSLVGAATAEAVAALGEVVLYSAAWCGACKATRRLFQQRKLAFVEKDIEKDAAANAEMQRKAKAAGKTPRGVPVIDFAGEILMGFDKPTLERLIAQRGV